MYSYARAIVYAMILWGTVFLITFFLYPLRAENPVFFVTVRMLVMALLSVALTAMYFRDVEEQLIRDGLKLGVLWLVASILFDQGPFVWGLMRLSFVDYLMDTGLGYLLYPIVTIGAGYLLSTDKSIVEDSEASRAWTGSVPAVSPGSKQSAAETQSGPKPHV